MNSDKNVYRAKSLCKGYTQPRDQIHDIFLILQL